MDAATTGALLSKVSAVTNRGGRITSSGTYTPTVTGWHRIRCQGGGGGSGGVKFTVGSGTIRSGGGEAGEYVCADMWLVKGVAYTYTVGAAGTAGATTPTNGGTGGNTSFEGPDFIITALGGAGSPLVSTSASAEGNGGTATARRDGSTTQGAPTVQSGPDVWSGANGGTSNGVAGGYAGCFSGITSSARGGSGGCSLFAQGGGGASAANTSGTAGTLGSGAGGSWTGTTTGIAGAAGGAGFIEIAFIGAN